MVSSKPSRPRNSLLAGITVVWLLLATVLFLYWNDIDAVPSLDFDFLHSSTSGTTARVALPSLDEKITAEEKNEYARNLVRLNETLRERFPHHENWYASRKTTLETLEGLAECLEADTCTDGQGDIVLAGSMHFGNSLGGGVSGEDIWARSSIDAFHELGRTVLISYALLETLDIYQAIPKLITRVIIDRIEVDQCVGYGRPAKLRMEDFTKGRARNMTDEEMLQWELESVTAEEGSSWGFRVLENQDTFERGGCIRREGYPQGIPLWKIFSFHFWQGPGHPLGRNWTLSPEEYKKHPCQNGSPGNFYLGYSVEKYCQRFVDPPEQRLHRAYILAKYVHILDSDEFAWDSPNKTLFADLSEKYNISFVAGADHQGDVSIQKGITNMGRMPEDEFYKELALGRLVVGVGMPMISPTPYDALCLGVPFLNPLWRWDEKNPADSSAWCSQHDGLLEVGAPYVYHVRKRDLAHFEEAVAAAMERTIDPYIPPHMTADANRKRHQELLERDWESESVPFMAALQNDRFHKGIY